MRVSNSIPAIALALSSANAFYLPGVAPTSFDKDALVPLNVNSLTPAVSRNDEQIHAVVAYDYYHPAFRFCQPNGGVKDVRESLGSIIFGDRIRTSPFELHMGRNETCKALCESPPFDQQAAVFVNQRIEQAYNVNFLIDGLPAAELHEDLYTGEIYSSPGFPLGKVKEDGTKVLHNHWDIVVDFHKAGIRGKEYRVVGVIVYPKSDADAKQSAGQAECGTSGRELVLNEQEGSNTPVTYTYSIYWRESPTAWATRWDKYLHVEDPKIHWFSLINSTIFVVFLLGMVSTILLRALRKDIARYNRLDNINLDDLSGTSAVGGGDDDIQEDSGWKLVHGDVFRAPRYALLLSVLLGNGAQLFFMVGFTVLFAMLGILSPSNRGWLTTVGMLLYTVFGFVSGYVSSRSYKTFGGEQWKLNMAATPALVPGVVFATFFLMNLFVWFRGSSGAVPFSTMLAIIFIWFVISVPLSVLGSWFGFKAPVIEAPTRVNQIPRQIPTVSRSLSLWPSVLMTGVLPFCAIFVELYFIMTSLWTSKIYYMFGFLFISYGLLVLTAACTTVLLVYFMLCAEDYRWQWRAFVGSGMTGGYVFLYSLGFWAMKIKFSSLLGLVLFTGYSALIGVLVFLLCGTLGFLAAFAFAHRIYRSIKID